MSGKVHLAEGCTQCAKMRKEIQMLDRTISLLNRVVSIQRTALETVLNTRCINGNEVGFVKHMKTIVAEGLKRVRR